MVYKRRIALSQDEALGWLAGEHPCPRPGQIGAEIDYFLDFYRPLVPTVFLSSEREACCSAEEPGFRLTFDERILCRRVDISLGSEACGTPLLPGGRVLMELKCTGGIPMWLVRELSAGRIYKTSFSKYGTAYRTLIWPEQRKEAARYA